MTRISLGDVFSLMERTKGKYLYPIHAAVDLEFHNLSDHNLWPVPTVSDGEVQEFETKEITTMDGGRQDLLSRCARDVAKSVQFPVSTAFLHGMGIIATAMTPSFHYQYYGSLKRCNLYIVTSQPTGAGKSAMHDYFYKPVETEYIRISKDNAKDRRRCMLQIEQYEKQMAQAENINEAVQLEMDILAEQEKLKHFPSYTYTWTDITPEALEKHAGKQNGLFNLVSDEATIINTLLGSVYSDNIKNNEMLLKGWDGDLVSSARVGRGGYYGNPNGNVAVCAQDETLKAIFQAGERGNGICQRFLLHREPTMMGAREYGAGKFIPTSGELKAEYCRLVNRLMSENDVTLTFSDKAMDVIYMVKNEYEATISDNGSNSQEMLRGVVAKVDKQIMKLSCILHVISEWGDKGEKSKVITEDTAFWAFSIYDALLDSFVNSASSQGFIGKNTEINKIKDCIIRYSEKGKKYMTIQQLKDMIKNVQPFKGHTNIVKRIRNDILPEIEKDGWICVDGSRILINPKLK